MDYTSNENHAGLDKVLEWNEIYKPQQILLTNMRHEIDYHKITEILPGNIKPLYDGYKFTVN
jgi:phosphoribosyl 1,2-cyclic phosphate phosphodiesterase